MAFLPGGAMLVGELGGTVRRALPPYTQLDPTPFLQITNIARNYSNQGLYTIAVDPAFATNHYIYVVYTLGHAQSRSPVPVHRQPGAHERGQ